MDKDRIIRIIRKQAQDVVAKSVEDVLQLHWDQLVQLAAGSSTLPAAQQELYDFFRAFDAYVATPDASPSKTVKQWEDILESRRHLNLADTWRDLKSTSDQAGNAAATQDLSKQLEEMTQARDNFRASMQDLDASHVQVCEAITRIVGCGLGEMADAAGLVSKLEAFADKHQRTADKAAADLAGARAQLAEAWASLAALAKDNTEAHKALGEVRSALTRVRETRDEYAGDMEEIDAALRDVLGVSAAEPRTSTPTSALVRSIIARFQKAVEERDEAREARNATWKQRDEALAQLDTARVGLETALKTSTEWKNDALTARDQRDHLESCVFALHDFCVQPTLAEPHATAIEALDCIKKAQQRLRDSMLLVGFSPGQGTAEQMVNYLVCERRELRAQLANARAVPLEYLNVVHEAKECVEHERFGPKHPLVQALGKLPAGEIRCAVGFMDLRDVDTYADPDDPDYGQHSLTVLPSIGTHFVQATPVTVVWVAKAGSDGGDRVVRGNASAGGDERQLDTERDQARHDLEQALARVQALELEASKAKQQHLLLADQCSEERKRADAAEALLRDNRVNIIEPAWKATGYAWGATTTLAQAIEMLRADRDELRVKLDAASKDGADAAESAEQIKAQVAGLTEKLATYERNWADRCEKEQAALRRANELAAKLDARPVQGISKTAALAAIERSRASYCRSDGSKSDPELAYLNGLSSAYNSCRSVIEALDDQPTRLPAWWLELRKAAERLSLSQTTANWQDLTVALAATAPTARAAMDAATDPAPKALDGEPGRMCGAERGAEGAVVWISSDSLQAIQGIEHKHLGTTVCVFGQKSPHVPIGLYLSPPPDHTTSTLSAAGESDAAYLERRAKELLRERNDFEQRLAKCQNDLDASTKALALMAKDEHDALQACVKAVNAQSEDLPWKPEARLAERVEATVDAIRLACASDKINMTAEIENAWRMLSVPRDGTLALRILSLQERCEGAEKALTQARVALSLSSPASRTPMLPPTVRDVLIELDKVPQTSMHAELVAALAAMRSAPIHWAKAWCSDEDLRNLRKDSPDLRPEADDKHSIAVVIAWEKNHD